MAYANTIRISTTSDRMFRSERGLRPRNPVWGRFGRGAEPPSELS